MSSRLTTQDFPTLQAWLERLMSPQFRWTLQGLQEILGSGENSLVLRDSKQGLRAFLIWQILPQALEISVLATDPGSLRSGLMSKLLEQFIAQHQGPLEIWLEVHEFNSAARKLYEKFAFRQVGKRLNYYTDGAAALLFSRHA